MDDPRSVLLIQLKRAGDVLVTTPLLPALRRRYPQARIGFLCDRLFTSLLINNPDVDVIEPYDRGDVWGTLRRIRAARYDWILDFQSSPRSAVVCLTSGARLTAGYRVPFWGRAYKRTVKRPGGRQSVVDGKFTLLESLTGPLGARPSRRLFLTDHEKAWGLTAMPSASSDRKPIGLVPTHRHYTRRWPADHVVTLAQKLLSEGEDVWLFWGPGEESYVQAIAQKAPGSRMIPATTFRQMAALFERCQLVVTNDNGPMHLAVSVGVRTLTAYGPTDPATWNPGGPDHRVIQAPNVPCLGCNLNDCPFGHECMHQLLPEMMLKETHAMLTAGTQPRVAS